MLQTTNTIVANCYRHAQACAEKAQRAMTASDRHFFQDMERRWLFLARSCEFTDRAAIMSNEIARRLNAPK